MKRKLLVLELWGVGDLAIASPFLQAVSEKYDVTLLAKCYAFDLQKKFWPKVKVISLNAPWTAFRSKYHLWKWPWSDLRRVRKQLVNEQFDFAVSARWDPRDDFFIWLTGAKQRLGFPRLGSAIFLNHPLLLPKPRKHRYENWRIAARELGVDLPERKNLSFVRENPADKIVLHSGAGHPVRVWPLERYQNIIRHLRENGFQIQVVCDVGQREWWLQHGEENVSTPRDVTELWELLCDACAFIGNDSGSGHLAAICGVPTLTIFGPQLPELFAPLSKESEIIEGKPCRYKPCSDYCRFPAPYCLLNVTEEEVRERAIQFATTHAI